MLYWYIHFFQTPSLLNLISCPVSGIIRSIQYQQNTRFSWGELRDGTHLTRLIDEKCLNKYNYRLYNFISHALIHFQINDIHSFIHSSTHQCIRLSIYPPTILSFHKSFILDSIYYSMHCQIIHSFVNSLIDWTFYLSFQLQHKSL